MKSISNADIEKLSLADIAKNNHASLRTIEYAFKSRIGITPKKFIIIERLNRVRRELLDADPDISNVSRQKIHSIISFSFKERRMNL